MGKTSIPALLNPLSWRFHGRIEKKSGVMTLCSSSIKTWWSLLHFRTRYLGDLCSQAMLRSKIISYFLFRWELCFGFSLESNYQFYLLTQDSEQHSFKTARWMEMILEASFHPWPTALASILTQVLNIFPTGSKTLGQIQHDSERLWDKYLLSIKSCLRFENLRVIFRQTLLFKLRKMSSEWCRNG